MGEEVHIQSQNERTFPNSPTPTPTPNKHKNLITPNSSPTPQSMGVNIDHHSLVEPTDHLFSMMHLNNASDIHRQPPLKRRSPCSSSSGAPSAKKLFCAQEDLTLHGFSAGPLPLNFCSLVNKKPSFPVLRRCLSDPYHSPAPENSTPPARGSGLPPLPPSLRRTVSDVTTSHLTPSPDKASSFSRSLSSEETTNTATPDYMRLRRMKDRLKEMRQWWDEVMKEEEEEEEECAVAEEDNKVHSSDELGRDSEEAVHVERAEKGLSIIFRCPCGKGYEILLSENNCYCKLV